MDDPPEDAAFSSSMDDQVYGIRLSPFRQAPSPLVDDRSNAARPEVRNLEYAITAPGRTTGLDVDLAIAPRAGVAVGPEGGQLRSAGAEVRLGQRLEGMVRDYEGSSWDRPSWYMFVATDGQALTWAPEMQAAGANRGLRFQEERVVVGDAQVGVSMEANGLQASFSYMNRDISQGGVNRKEDFVGATLTMRR